MKPRRTSIVAAGPAHQLSFRRVPPSGSSGATGRYTIRVAMAPSDVPRTLSRSRPGEQGHIALTARRHGSRRDPGKLRTRLRTGRERAMTVAGRGVVLLYGDDPRRRQREAIGRL